MSRNRFYRYNPTTDTYERVYPSRRQRLLGMARNLLEGIAIGAVILLVVYAFVDLPKEKRLRTENEHLHAELANINSRLDRALDVMDLLADRDNNFYRVIMQLDPLTAQRRVAAMADNDTATSALSLTDRQLVNSVTKRLSLFERLVVAQSQSFDTIARAISQSDHRLAHIPSIQPISERDMTQMASGYGYRIDPIYGTAKHHDGMDFASPIGTPVYATADGTVSDAGRSNSGYGNLIEISHGYNFETRYAHLSKILVRKGQKVTRGELIGLVGSTGKSTGAHLHYEVRYKGAPQNPVNFYFQDLTPEEYSQMVEESENDGHVMD
jgi:murein DD-endopeptidase MepM/ murein hydrolase activator NlpD